MHEISTLLQSLFVGATGRSPLRLRAMTLLRLNHHRCPCANLLDSDLVDTGIYVQMPAGIYISILLPSLRKRRSQRSRSVFHCFLRWLNRLRHTHEAVDQAFAAFVRNRHARFAQLGRVCRSFIA
jgi:hypothetical protein